MVPYRFTIVVERDEDGAYVSLCPALQRCCSRGDTYEEAVEQLMDAIHLDIKACGEIGESIPVEVAVDKVEINV